MSMRDNFYIIVKHRKRQVKSQAVHEPQAYPSSPAASRQASHGSHPAALVLVTVMRRSQRLLSVEGESAIHVDCLPGNEIALCCAQEHDNVD
jgi:hypothetical protein